MPRAFTDLDRAVFFTLVYSNVFTFPLTLKEIQDRLPRVWDWSFLTGQKTFSHQPALPRSLTAIKKSLSKLLAAHKLEKQSVKRVTYYYLAGHEANVQQRMNRKQAHQLRQAALIDFLEVVKQVPGILAVAITGSTAVANAKLDDDLDFLIVTKANHLWLSRLYLLVLAKLLGKRVQLHQVDQQQAWCFNLWLDETSLAVFKHNFSIYQAYEAKQLQWLLDKGQISDKWWEANQVLDQLVKLPSSSGHEKVNREQALVSLANFLVYLLQRGYRYLKFGQENFKVDLHQAYLNDVKRQIVIFNQVERLMSEYEMVVN